MIRASLLGLALFSLAGCSDDLASLAPFPCARDGTCPAGFTCGNDHECRSTCTDGQGCAAGFACSAARGVGHCIEACAPVACPSRLTACMECDIGSPLRSGSSTVSGATVTISGSGADVGCPSDQLHYLFGTWHGAGSFTARVASMTVVGGGAVSPAAKAGIMVRGSIEPTAPFAFLLGTPGQGVALEERNVSGVCSSDPGPAAALPVWLRLDRSQFGFAAFTSTDGRSWTPFAMRAVGLGDDVLVGLAVSAHDDASLAQAQLTDVLIGVGG